MARSKYIYIVTRKGSKTPVAAFTVKYESQNWAEAALGIARYDRYRMADNQAPKLGETWVKCDWETNEKDS